MFDQVKDQIKGYLPEKLSPVVSAFIVGTITFIVVAILLSAEIIRPGITDLVPPLILQMMVLTITTFLAGIVAWIIKRREDKNETLKVQGNKVDTRKDKEQDEYFNYYLRHNSVTYTVLSSKRATYEDERIFVASGNIRYPATVLFEPLISGIKIRLVDCVGYKPAKTTWKDLRKWRDSFTLETDFRGPIQEGTEHVAWAKVEVSGSPLPDHVYSGSRQPIKGKISIVVDLHRLKGYPKYAKLFTFISYRATKPLQSSSKAPTKNFTTRGKLTWNIFNPVVDYMYVVSWKEPCECSWCSTINFD